MASTTTRSAWHRMPVGTPRHYRWLHGIVATLLVLNLLDALFTLVWVRLGLAEEANLILRELVSTRPVLFVAVKLGLVSLGSLLLWRLRRRPVAVIGIFLAFLVYYWLLIVHLSYSSILVRNEVRASGATTREAPAELRGAPAPR